jgi:hypothetical protein
VTYTLDGEPTDIIEFIHANTAPDVETLTLDEIAMICNLKPGEFIALGAMCILERVS